jgi:hypothetical protein
VEALVSTFGGRQKLSVWLTDPAGATLPSTEQVTTGEGTAHFWVSIPADARSGRWALTVQGQTSGHRAIATLTVAGSDTAEPPPAGVTPGAAAPPADGQSTPTPADATATATATPTEVEPTPPPTPTETPTPTDNRDISHLLPPASPGGPPSARLLRTYFGAASRATGVPVEVLLAVAAVESGFRPEAKGPYLAQFAGTEDEHALGMMQFLPSTYRPYAPIVDRITGKNLGMRGIWDPESSVYAAAMYLRDRGALRDIHRALFAYNNADWYVRLVLAWSEFYANGGAIGHAPILDPARLANLPDPTARTIVATDTVPSDDHNQNSRPPEVEGLTELLTHDLVPPSWPRFPTADQARSH